MKLIDFKRWKESYQEIPELESITDNFILWSISIFFSVLLITLTLVPWQISLIMMACICFLAALVLLFLLARMLFRDIKRLFSTLRRYNILLPTKEDKNDLQG